MYKDVEKMYSSPKNKLIEVHTSHYPSQAFYMIDKLHKGINIFTNKNSQILLLSQLDLLLQRLVIMLLHLS
jgi:hypothetical protein